MMPPCLYGVVLNCRVPRRRGIPFQLTNLWTVASRERFYTHFLVLTSENQDDRDAKAPVQPMLVYDVISRRPISTNMLARTGSRTRSEMRAATWLPIEIPGREPSSRAPTMYQSTLPMSQWPRPATRVRGTACARSEPTMRTGGSRG